MERRRARSGEVELTAVNDVGTRQDAAEVEVLGDTYLELLVQFHGLALGRKCSGLLGAADRFVQYGKLHFLFLRESADAALFVFHVVDIGGHGADQGAGGGGVATGQPFGEAGLARRR